MNRLGSLLGGLGLVAVGFGLLSALLAIFQPVTDIMWIVGNLAIGVMLLSAALFVSFDGVRQRLQSGEARRVGKYGSSAVLSALLGIAVLAMLGWLAGRHSVQLDWSEQKVNTLTEQTLGLLERLEAPVLIQAFFQQTEIAQVSALLGRYDRASDRIELQFIDPNSVPLMVEELDLDPEALARGLVRVEQAGVGVVVTELDEPSITNALLKLGRGSEKKVYFVAGHNERPIANAEGAAAEGKESVGRAADALRNETYAVESLPMAARGEIPEDADVVVIAGPTRPYFDHELEALRAYVAKGGALLVMIDPRAQTNLYVLLDEWGVEMGDDVVADQVQAIPGRPTWPFATAYAGDHPITEKLPDATLFPMVRSVQAATGRQEEYEVIVATSPDSWAERDLDGWRESGRATLGEGDLDGPVPIAVAGHPGAAPADSESARAKLVVFGDSDFATNEIIDVSSNRDLFVNSVNWLIGDVEQIAIRPPLSRASRFQLNAAQLRTLVYLSLFVLPQTIAIIGVVAWWLRREGA